MDLTALLLSRIQFGSTIAFHIIFPSFSIGLAAWLTVLDALHLWTGPPVYRLIFEFWLKIPWANRNLRSWHRHRTLRCLRSGHRPRRPCWSKYAGGCYVAC